MVRTWLRLLNAVILSLVSLTIAACSSSGSETIDSLLGNLTRRPILNSIADQVIQQTDLLSVDVNNIYDGQPGNDEDMSYSCYYDSVLDEEVASTQPCTSFPNATVTFNAGLGKLELTPNAGVLGNFEFRITGVNEEGAYDEVFTVGVRLKFNGITAITAITGTSATMTWTQPADAVGYQIFRLNTATGAYELFRTITGGNISGTTITGLTPNTGYTIRAQAVDALGNLDGNVVSRSFTTTELVQFSMTPATATVPAGTAQTITVQAYNANGTPQTVGGLTITPGIAAGTSTGTFGPVNDNGDGTYSFTFTPAVVGTNLTIDVSIAMTFFIQNTVELTIIHGPASTANSNLTLSSNSVISGQDINIQTTIRDAYNNPIESGSVIALHAAGGTSTGTFSAVTNAGAGLYTATYTGVLAGTAKTITVSVNGVFLGLSGTIAVTPGAPISANSTLTISAATISSGTSATITATLRDLNNNPVPSGILVGFNKAGGTSTGAFSSVVNAGAGVYTTTYEGNIAGTAQTITVSADSVPLAMTVSVTVVPGAPVLANSSLVTTAPTVISGQFVDLSATLRDLNNNPVVSGITVTFTKTGGTATGTFGAVSNQGGGLYTVRFTGVGAGTAQTMRVLIGGVDLGATTSVAVTPGAPSPVNSTIAVSAATVVSGNSVTVTATLRDANNNTISSGVLVGISKTGGSSTGTLSSITNAGAGVYTASYTGVLAGSAQTIGILVDSSELGPTTSLQVLVGPADLTNSSLVISSSTVTSGQFVTVTATLRDVNNNPISTGPVITFSKTGGTSTGTFSNQSNLGDGSYTVRYNGVGAGTAQTINVLLDGINLGPTVSVNVIPGSPSNTTSTITVSSATVASGAAVTVTATIRDSNSNPIPSGILVAFSKSGGTSTGLFDTVTNGGSGQYTTTYTGVAAGSAQTLGVSVDSSAMSITTSVTVVPGAPNILTTTLDVTANTVVAGTSITMTMTLRDGNSNPISAGYIIDFTATGGTSTGVISSTTNQGNGVYTATYTGDVAGTAQTLQGRVDMASFGPTQSIQTLVGYPVAATSTLTITPATVASGSNRTISALIRDVRNNPITSQYGITFDTTGGTSTGTLSGVNNAGSGNFSVVYTGVASGTAQTVRILVDGTPLAGLTGSLTVTPGPIDVPSSSLSITQTTVQSGTSATISASLRDANGNRISGSLVTFNKSSTAGSDGNISPSPANETGPPVNSGNYQTVYTATQQGAAQTLTLVVDGTPVPAMTLTLSVTAGPPAQLALTQPTLPFNTTQCVGPFTVTLKDAANNTTVTLSDIVVNLSSPDTDSNGDAEHLHHVFSDASCNTEITELPFTTGGSVATFYYRNYLPVSYTLTFDAPNPIADNTMTMTTQAVLSWIGAGTSGSTMSGSGSGFIGSDQGASFGFTESLDMIVSGSNLFVSDRGGNRILKFDLSTNPYTYVGWIGYIESLDGISAACSSQAVGDWTNDWCTGGRAQQVNGMDLLYGIGVDTTYIYVTSQHRVLRFAKSNGALGGWIGRVSSITGMTCTGGTPTANLMTPGWCTGGTHTSGNFNGQFNNAIDVTVIGTKLFVSDLSNHRIQRWTNAGIYEGWIGNINQGSANGVTSGSPDPAYDAACVAASTGNFTPGFCAGAAAQIMTRREWPIGPPENPIPGEGFSNPMYLDNDGTYLYIGDNNNTRIARVDLSANPVTVTWIGMVLRNTATNPTVPAQSTTTYTTTWVSGGSTRDASNFLGINPLGIANDGTYMFIGDSYHRVIRVDLANGQNKFHLGRVSASPTGGQAGCSSTPVMGTTPGWCSGGDYNRYGSSNSTFAEGRATAVYGSELLVMDRYNFRIQRFNKLTGAFIGWMGAVSSNQDAWTMTMPASFTRKGWNNQSIWDSITQSSTFGMYGDYMYLPDMGVGRIKRYNKRIGTFGGYVGIFNFTVGFLPTGPDACLGITSGMTPDWCTGGGKTQPSGAVQGYNNPTSVTADDTYVYVASLSNVRVDRFHKDTTLYGGWLGRINGGPTDGDPGCVGGSGRVNGWCIGGSAQSGNANGEFRNNLRTVYYHSSTDKLFVADDSRIHRIDPDGTHEASLGHIHATTPAPVGCTLTNNVPNQWCTTSGAAGGGTNNYGGVLEPIGMWASQGLTPDYLYVSDLSNHRILRFNLSTGAPAGFIGRQALVTGLDTVSGSIATNPCFGITGFPRALPGWCEGTSVGVALATPQTGASGSANEFNSPRGIWGDNTYLYVADTLNHRIVRILIADGSFQGWKGAINSTTGMSADCIADAAAVGYTRRWCTGGSSILSSRMGGFNMPIGIAGDANYLYVHDGKNNRLVTIPKDI